MAKSLVRWGVTEQGEAQLPGLCLHLLGQIAIQATPAVGIRVGAGAQIPVTMRWSGEPR